MALDENPLSGQILRNLVILVEEASVTRAAHRLGISQPAMSLILKQLRTVFDDPLLVRSQGGMVRTERADQLRSNALHVLQEMDNLLLNPEGFDPLTCSKAFTIALPDHIAPQMFNGIMREFRAQAPKARLNIRALSAEYDFEGALSTGNADLVISNWPTPPAHLMTSRLFDDEFVLLLDRNHAFTRNPPTVEEYLRSHHVAPADYAVLHRGVVETHLHNMHLSRARFVEVGYFSMAPYLLSGTDLVFTVTRRFAAHFARFLPLAIVPSPLAYPRVNFYQLWHERLHHSPTHRWLRRLVADMRILHDRDQVDSPMIEGGSAPAVQRDVYAG